MKQELTLKRLQTELTEEKQRLAHLRLAFQAPHCADELDAASHLEAAHLAQSHARHSAERIRGLQSLLNLLRHGGHRRCADCGEEIPEVRLLAAPGATRCQQCQQCLEAGQYGGDPELVFRPAAQDGFAGSC